MRARKPDLEGRVVNGDVGIGYEIYDGEGPTVVLIPTWSLVHSRFWKMQIPYLARHFRVITYDPRGNGKSDRPAGAENHDWRKYLDDLITVLDATETQQAVLVGVSFSGYFAQIAAVEHAQRVLGVISIAPPAGLGIALAERTRYSYTDVLDTTEGWAKENIHFIRSRYAEYVEFFASKIFSEPHSTKAIEDTVSYAMETDAETLIATDTADVQPSSDMSAYWSRIDCPLLLIQGDRDAIIAPEATMELARITGAPLITMLGSGHCPHVRDPVAVNLIIREFVERVAGDAKVTA
jgi:pimeloyl-ACP methyl ester carboxylesterase